MEAKRHESYGMCGISRTTGGERSLFGSKLKHSNTIRLTISGAKVSRRLNQDWFYADRDSKIVIEMSSLQYAELISSPNTEGTPVTIISIDRDVKESPPFKNVIDRQSEEFKNDIDTYDSRLKSDIEEAKIILGDKKQPKRDDKNFIIATLNTIHKVFSDYVPSAKEQFDRAMDGAISEAKSEIESYHLDRIVTLGIDAYKTELELKSKRII